MNKILKSSSGVTLIELLIVIIVLGIIASFSIVAAGNIIENTKQKGDIAVVSNLNEASNLMRYSNVSQDIDIFDGYTTDEERLTFMFNEGYISKIPEPGISTNSFVYDETLQIWQLNGSGGSVIYAETDSAFFSTQYDYRITAYDISGGLSIVIPTQIDGKTITELGQDSFRGLGLNSVVIQEGITRISGNSFHSNNLTSVSIPNSVTTIWHNAFNANKITSVSFGTGLSNIKAGAFSNNYITSVSLPPSVKTVGNGAFAYGSNFITSITIGSDVTIESENSFGYYGKAFNDLYNIDKSAGTYTYSGGTWSKE